MGREAGVPYGLFFYGNSRISGPLHGCIRRYIRAGYLVYRRVSEESLLLVCKRCYQVSADCLSLPNAAGKGHLLCSRGALFFSILILVLCFFFRMQNHFQRTKVAARRLLLGFLICGRVLFVMVLGRDVNEAVLFVQSA